MPGLGVGLLITRSTFVRCAVRISPSGGLLRLLRAEPVAEGGADGMKAAGVERRYGCAGGKSSEGENPMSVTGMKQGRQFHRGINRQEGEKPCRRPVFGCGKPGVFIVDPVERRR